MIKCDKENVKIKGDLMLIEAETAMIIRGVRCAIEEKCGKEHAERLMQRIYEISSMTDEEIKENTEKIKQEIAKRFGL